MQKERYLWMDMLNILACVGVLILHTNSTIVHSYSGEEGLSFLYAVFTHSAVYWPVPVFLMLSGCNIIGYNGGGFVEKRFKKAILPFLLWTSVYLIFFNLRDLENIFTPAMIWCMLNGHLGAGYMWFFIPLFAFYLSAPYLTAMMKNITDKQKRIFLLLSFTFCSLIPFLGSLLNVELFKFNLFPLATSMLIYPIAGYILNNDNWFYQNRKKLYVIGLVSFLIHFIGLYVTISCLGLSSRVIQNTCYPTNFFMSLAVFLFAKHYNWSSSIKWFGLSSKSVKFISSCSLGIYLIQNLLFVISSHNLNLLNNQYYGFVITYIVAFLLVLVMKKIPIVKLLVP